MSCSRSCASKSETNGASSARSKGWMLISFMEVMLCEVRAGGKKIHRTTLMREKWIFGSIYERPGLAE